MAESTTQKNDQSAYPGMICSGIEFFNFGEESKVIINSKIIKFNELPYSVIQTIEESISSQPSVNKALNEWFPESNSKRTRQYVFCRFGGLDHTPDILGDEMQDGEHWECPRRSVCKYSGIICKAPTINGYSLSPTEIKIVKFICSDMTNETLAVELGIPLGSLHQYKLTIYKKFGVQTKQEIAVKAAKLNLI